MASIKGKKDIEILVIASIVILIGVIGCVFCIGGAIGVKNFKLDLPDTTNLTSSIKGGLDTAANLVGNLSVALRSGTKTISEAKDSLYNVEDITKNTANAVEAIADAMDFNIFGFQPLAGASEYFDKIGVSIVDLGKRIISIADNIDVNTADVERIASDMDDLSIKLRDISNNFGTSLFTLPDFGFKRILYSIFTFAGILSFAFVLIGTGMILINRKINLYLTK